MLFNLLLLIFITSCSSIDLSSAVYDTEITTSLITPNTKEEFNAIDWELKRLFKTSNPIRKCHINIGIQKTILTSGISSTFFSVNENIALNVNYDLQCNDGIKTSNTITQSTDFTLQQEKTIAQYVGQNKITNEMASQIAKLIHDEIRIFFIVYKNKKH